MTLHKNAPMTFRDVLNVKVKVLSPGAIFYNVAAKKKEVDKAVR